MGLLEFVNFMGGGSDLSASSSWGEKKKSLANLVSLWKNLGFDFLSRTVLGLCLTSAK